MFSTITRLSTLAVVYAATALPALAQPGWPSGFWTGAAPSGGAAPQGAGSGGFTGFSWFAGLRRSIGNTFGGGNSGMIVGEQNRAAASPVAVPEIDASTGLLALAAVLAALAFAWEVRRRRAQASA